MYECRYLFKVFTYVDMHQSTISEMNFKVDVSIFRILGHMDNLATSFVLAVTLYIKDAIEISYPQTDAYAICHAMDIHAGWREVCTVTIIGWCGTAMSTWITSVSGDAGAV